MKDAIHVVLFIVRIVAFLITGAFALFLIYNEIMGSYKATKLLEQIKFPLNYHQVMIVGFIAILVLAVVTFIIHRNKI